MRQLWPLPALALVGLWLSGRFELAEDEAYYWLWSQQLAAGYYDHPPAIAWLIRGGVELLGHSERGLRLLPMLSALVGLGLAASRSPRPALALALLYLCPLGALGGLIATPDLPLMGAWGLGIWAAQDRRWGWLGLAAGMAMLSKYTGLLLLPLAWLGLGRPLRERGPYLAALVALLVYAPNALWNIDHDFVSWRFQLQHASEARPEDPRWLAMLGTVGAQLGLVGPLLAPLALWAGLQAGRRGGAEDRLLLWMSLPVLLIGALTGGKANWLAPGWLGLLLLLSRLQPGQPGQRHLGPAIGLNAVLSGLLLVQLLHPIYSLPVDPRDRLSGGRQLGEAVRAWAPALVYTSRYQEAALITFYGGVPARPFPGDRRLSQFDLWPAPLVDEAFFLRPWRGEDITRPEQQGYQLGEGQEILALVEGARPDRPRAVGRWQLWRIQRVPPASR